ncbi:MAG: OmpH family outer membrane protein [Burkholderiales bacterium]|nr:OmpH family outer membrane protein [Burkholderiales bacterium]
MNDSARALLLAGAMLAAAAPPAAAQQAAGGARIGFVNTERVMREAAPAQQAQKRLRAEVEKRDQEMRVHVAQLRKLEEALNRTTPPLGEAERSSRQREYASLNREFERKKHEYGEELALRRNEAMGQVLEQANRAIRRVAEQENLDIVFQEAAYANPRIDITDKVIRAVNAGAPAGGK